jgi:L-ascorbate metabolism protein UlaG (beta-lactamase superfamily)
MRAALAGLLLAGCTLYSTRPYRGPKSDHFDGEEFFNPHLTGEDSRGFFDLLAWIFTRDRGEWPERFHAEPGPRPPLRVGRGELRITFVNHATVLIQMDGINVLTDPVWSDVVGPTSFTGVERVRPPGIRFDDLPPIDLVLISHNHYDHCDLPTLSRLQERFAPRIAAGLGTASFLGAHGIRNARDFDWWSSVRVARDVVLTSVPVQHFSRRGVFDGDTMLWSGFVVEGPSGRVYFSGDTGYGPHFAQAAERLGPMRVALLPIGAYRPRWFMAPVHIDPEQAVKAHRDLRARTSVGIHFGTFRQADDGFTEPVEDLQKALLEAGLPEDDFIVLPEGLGRTAWR